MKAVPAIIVLMLAFNLFCRAQESLFKTTKDKFTGETRKTMVSPLKIQRNEGGAIWIDLNQTGGGNAFTALVDWGEFGCVDDNNRAVYFLAADGSRYEAINDVMGCKGSVVILLDQGAPANANLKYFLRDKVIVSLRVNSDGLNFDVNIPKISAKRLQAAARELLGK